MRRLRGWLVLVPASVLIVGLFGSLRGAEGAGPWRAQIVDAETGQPLEGVVVVAWWLKYIGGPGGSEARYYAAEEVVTGPDGRFEIPAKIAFNWLPIITEIRGPEFRVFKPGYDHARTLRPELTSRGEALGDADLFTLDGVVIALQPLKTREDRLKFYRGLSPPPPPIPSDRRRRFDEAIDVERKYLGFGPLRREGQR